MNENTLQDFINRFNSIPEGKQEICIESIHNHISDLLPSDRHQAVLIAQALILSNIGGAVDDYITLLNAALLLGDEEVYSQSINEAMKFKSRTRKRLLTS